MLDSSDLNSTIQYFARPVQSVKLDVFLIVPKLTISFSSVTLLPFFLDYNHSTEIILLQPHYNDLIKIRQIWSSMSLGICTRPRVYMWPSTNITHVAWQM